jgi:hypothetical protein
VRLENGEIREQSLLQIPGNQGVEFRSVRSGRARLAQLTGKVLDSPDDVRFSSKSSRQLQPLSNHLLLLAAFLFLIDVAGRKFDWQYLRRRPQPVVTQESSSMSQLKKRKETAEKLWRSEDVLPIFQNEPTIDSPKESEPQRSDYMEQLKKAKQRTKN